MGTPAAMVLTFFYVLLVPDVIIIALVALSVTRAAKETGQALASR
jgi:hypothetical protein